MYHTREGPERWSVGNVKRGWMAANVLEVLGHKRKRENSVVGTGLGMMAGTGTHGGLDEEEKIVVCTGSELVLLETEETGKLRKRSVLNHQR